MKNWLKLLLGAIFVLIVAFIVFMRPQAVAPVAPLPSSTSSTPVATTTPSVSLKTYNSTKGGFAVQYDPSYQLKEESPAASTDWRYQDQDQVSGTKLITITIPKSFEPQTNFNEGQFRVGISSNSKAIADCLKPDYAGQKKLSNETINGIDFTVYQGTDAGAGNLYDATSFRTVHNGACYSIDMIIHSTQLANYPPEMHIQEFDRAKAYNALHDILNTFRFQ